MKTFVAISIVLIGVPVLVWAGDDATDKVKLQGSWGCVALIEKGNPETRDVKRLTLVIKGDKYIYQLDKTTFTATFKLDPAAKPKSIDVMFEEGPLKGKSMLAIYALSGDTLTICGGDKRPREFASTKEAGSILFTFKRQKQ